MVNEKNQFQILFEEFVIKMKVIRCEVYNAFKITIKSIANQNRHSTRDVSTIAIFFFYYLYVVKVIYKHTYTLTHTGLKKKGMKD